ncbi:unnamed protein product [Leptidea sinapis]|uniref:DOMON domain-containing protein n=1 Tax=Leptidea sinapis TaxID=189913 RepID=A0A5E4PYS8_9NEOP|nr:unnamed protein product [Leptidea sinapis]
MNIQSFFILSALLICDAKLPRYKQTSQLNEVRSNYTQNSHTERKSEKTSRIVNEYRRHRRESFDSRSYESSLIWAHSERLDESGDVLLRWVNTDTSITFRLEARTRGYVGLGFNSARNMRGADLVVAWVDDRHGNAQLLNYELISGYQNETHTTLEFRRQLDTHLHSAYDTPRNGNLVLVQSLQSSRTTQETPYRRLSAPDRQ